MRFVLTLTVLVFIAASSMAAESPFDRGAYKLSGNISISSTSGDLYVSTTTIRLSPQFSYCLNNGFFLGGLFILEDVDYGDGSYRYYNYTNWMLGLTFEKYFSPTIYTFGDEQLKNRYKSRFIPFLKAMMAYGHNDEFGISTVSGTVGGLYMIANSAGIEIGVSFTHNRIESRSGSIIEFGTGINYFIF